MASLMAANSAPQQSSGNDEEAQWLARMQANFTRNQQWAVPAQSYQTQLAPQQETQFRAWLQQNQVPYNLNDPVQDYDMRGFWQALQSGDSRAASAIDPNDNRLHYPDYWKTPYHETFSNQSQWATPDAPSWTQDDKLIDRAGNIIFDDRAQAQRMSGQ
jgi:hypothetical protein